MNDQNELLNHATRNEIYSSSTIAANRQQQ